MAGSIEGVGAGGDPEVRPGSALASGLEHPEGVGLTGQVVLLGDHAEGRQRTQPRPRTAKGAGASVGIGQE